MRSLWRLEGTWGQKETCTGHPCKEVQKGCMKQGISLEINRASPRPESLHPYGAPAATQQPELGQNKESRHGGKFLLR